MARGNNQMAWTFTDKENVSTNALSRPKRARGGFTRYLLAISIGIAATLGWQSYGETAKRIIARRAPQLGWSPEAKQMIASGIRQLGWTKPSTDTEGAAVRPSKPNAPQPVPVPQTASATAAPTASAAPSPELQQVQQITLRLAEVRQAVEQLAATQDQMAGDIAKLQAADQEILQRVSAPRPRPATVPAHRSAPVTRPSSRPPTSLR
jgi:hypothetical protein